MIPRIAKGRVRGHSFKGAGMYYLHDKKALTSERVAWTETVNLPTQDPALAMRCMARTDYHSEELKRASGISTAGRGQTAGNVYAYSLSWHGEQEPDKEEMVKAAKATLEVLGLSAHEAVIVAHDDTDHKHIHIITNLVHPETGTVADLSYSQRRLQAWAMEYEREQGKVYCTEREENAEKRARGELTKHQDERVHNASDLTELYRQADSGRAFVAALKEAGYTLAAGDKNRLVIVDDAGRIQNLVRQIEGARKKDIEAKLSDVDLAALPAANDVAAERKARMQETEPEAATAPIVALAELQQAEAAPETVRPEQDPLFQPGELVPLDELAELEAMQPEFHTPPEQDENEDWETFKLRSQSAFDSPITQAAIEDIERDGKIRQYWWTRVGLALEKVENFLYNTGGRLRDLWHMGHEHEYEDEEQYYEHEPPDRDRGIDYDD